MEPYKFIILLIVSSSLLPFFAEAICVPRNFSNVYSHPEASGTADALAPAMSFISAAATGSPLPPPVSSPAIQSPLPPPVSSPAIQSPLPSPVSSPSPPDSPTHSASTLPLLSSNAALTKICDVTDYPAECLATVAPFLAGETNPISVLKIGIHVLQKSFEVATAVATKLINDLSTSAVVKDSLDTCVESFDSGVADLNDALAAISAHDIGRLSTLLSATITYSDTCEDAFAEQPHLESPLKEIDQHLDKLASINLAISASLQWSEIASPLKEINDCLDKLGSISISISMLVPGATII
ncbi:hypothetical protein SADUNF_Sadunf02G0169200 [Salix dunnii]|uniref:Pectinesterase inhibitor domain-containing protein n=1 Tax=Salix dunnii TaxID=1413687 RepID=A0A835TIJ5_9ROSI|nr:hypothetical protein SADUNF_Sadunf02G0169200 [Salix dunnii]